MPPKEPTKQQYSSRLAYNAQVPSFLQKLQNQYGGGGRSGSSASRNDNVYYDDEGNEWEDDGSGRPSIPRRATRGGDDGDGDGNGGGGEGELDEFGRERRPTIPERPSDDPGSAGEDDEDEKPQVVVLRKGKHLTGWEAENVRRAERGQALLPDPNKPKDQANNDASLNDLTSTSKKKISKPPKPSLSFSSAPSMSASSKAKLNALKRKALGEAASDSDDDDEDIGVHRRTKSGTTQATSSTKNEKSAGKGIDSDKKKPKKAKTTSSGTSSSSKKKNKTLLSFGDDA